MGTGFDLPFFFSVGIYICAKCSNELFSSLSTISVSTQSLPIFSQMIRHGALSRIPDKNSVNSFQVACSKCFSHVGREVVESGVKSHFTILNKDVLRLVKESRQKKKS